MWKCAFFLVSVRLCHFILSLFRIFINRFPSLVLYSTSLLSSFRPTVCYLSSIFSSWPQESLVKHQFTTPHCLYLPTSLRNFNCCTFCPRSCSSSPAGPLFNVYLLLHLLQSRNNISHLTTFCIQSFSPSFPPTRSISSLRQTSISITSRNKDRT